MVKGELEIHSKTLEFQTQGEEVDLIDLTHEIQAYIRSYTITDGRITVFVPGSTAAIITTEFEPRLNEDTKDMVKKLIPRGLGYRHDEIDDNAHSHLRATLLGSEMTIPIINNRAILGTWQQVVFADFDVYPRRRTVVLQIMGISS